MRSRTKDDLACVDTYIETLRWVTSRKRCTARASCELDRLLHKEKQNRVLRVSKRVRTEAALLSPPAKGSKWRTVRTTTLSSVPDSIHQGEEDSGHTFLKRQHGHPSVVSAKPSETWHEHDDRRESTCPRCRNDTQCVACDG